MPKQKDLKRLTRARMQKTGEAYTAARATLLAKKAHRGPTEGEARPQPPAVPTDATEPPVAAAAPPAAATPTAASEPPDYATLAGMSDETVRERTGCDWKRWAQALDSKGASSWSHTEIAAYVHEKFGISGWWAQSVTVGYERIKGLRAIGQRRGGGYEAAKSKTVPVPLDRLRRAFSDPRQRARWLPGAKPTVRKTTSKQSLRWTWEDGRPIVVWFTPKGDEKTQVAITHQELADRAEVEAKKAYWGERLAALAALLRS